MPKYPKGFFAKLCTLFLCLQLNRMGLYLIHEIKPLDCVQDSDFFSTFKIKIFKKKTSCDTVLLFFLKELPDCLLLTTVMCREAES